MVIQSPHNPRIKDVARLRERRHREAAGVMLIEGEAELALALAGGVQPQTVFVCRELSRDSAAAARLEALLKPEVEIVEVAPPVFNKIAYRQNPDGWLAVAPAPGLALEALRPGAAPLLLVCEAVEKPGNLGAMLRTADAAGVDALIVCDPATDLGNPNVVRASRGALFTVPIALATSRDALTWLKTRGIRIVAAAPRGAIAFTDADLRRPVALAVGAEDAGLSAAWLGQADTTVNIPMAGKVNSLNVAASAAILLYEAVRQAGQRR